MQFEFSQRPVIPHAVPQEPQLLGSVVTSTQLLVHSVSPAGHVTAPHTPAVQVALTGHDVVQLPQARGDEYRLRHRESHELNGGSQAATHPEGAHSGLPASQATLQLPQLTGLERSASQPLAGFPSQSAQPLSQESITQAPASHLATACTVEQGVQSAALHPLRGSSGVTQTPLHTLEPAAHVASGQNFIGVGGVLAGIELPPVVELPPVAGLPPLLPPPLAAVPDVVETLPEVAPVARRLEPPLAVAPGREFPPLVAVPLFCPPPTPASLPISTPGEQAASGKSTKSNDVKLCARLILG